MKYGNLSSKRGFSLVEMAVVMGIIGLVLGGILGGRHLLAVAEVNTLLQERDYYASAHRAFYDRYTAYPGDMADATRIFGSDSNLTGAEATLCINGLTSTAKSDGTCNGNGNQKTGIGDDDDQSELEYAIWAQHLARSGLIEGSFDGAYGAYVEAGGAVPGATHPIAKRKSTYWAVDFADADTRDDSYFNSFNNQHVLILGSTGITGHALTPEEMWSLDRKIDDGQAATGQLIAGNDQDNCVNAANSDDLNATYNFAYTGAGCSPAFLMGF